jgi:hypothetical protein
MVGASAYGGAELGQSGKAIGAFPDVLADLTHHFQPGFPGRVQVGQATAAGTITQLLGQLREGKEGDLLPMGAAARTGGAAVNAGGADGVNEVPVKAGVSRQDRAPLGFFGEAVGIDLVLQCSSH